MSIEILICIIISGLGALFGLFNSGPTRPSLATAVIGALILWQLTSYAFWPQLVLRSILLIALFWILWGFTFRLMYVRRC